MNPYGQPGYPPAGGYPASNYPGQQPGGYPAPGGGYPQAGGGYGAPAPGPGFGQPQGYPQQVGSIRIHSSYVVLYYPVCVVAIGL